MFKQLIFLVVTASAFAAELPSLDKAEVTIPYSELKALWQAAQPPKPAGPESPVASQLLAGHYVLVIESGQVRGTAEFDVQSFRDNWTVVPLLGEAVQVDSVEPADANLIAENRGYALALEHAGHSKIKLHFAAKLSSDGNAESLRFGVAPAAISTARSDVSVKLRSEPKKKGLQWYRTYLVDFSGDYIIENPTPITQTIYVRFAFPAADASYTDFSFTLNGAASNDDRKTSDGITEAVTLEAGKSAPLHVSYKTRGTDRWGYAFGDASRIRNFQLRMNTDFREIDFPAGTGSPTERSAQASGWQLTWAYPEVINAQPVGMEMPKVPNPGPVASRISFFAPVSLLFFFAVLLLVATMRGVNLHPMNYFFLAAGCFVFQLLFAYLVDLIPLNAAFFIAALVSLVLVSGYLWIAAGKGFARIAAAAQFAYMVLFSYSFFFDRLTGLTITIGAIITLALLMVTTAKVDWAAKFAPVPPPLPTT